MPMAPPALPVVPSFTGAVRGLGGVGAAHAPTALRRALVLVEPAPGAVLLRAGYRVVQALQANRAGLAHGLRLALPDLALRLALAIRAEEEQQILTTARRSILPPPVRAGKHSRLPTYLRHGSITSTKLVKSSVTVVLASVVAGLSSSLGSRYLGTPGRPNRVQKPPLQDVTRLAGVVFPHVAKRPRERAVTVPNGWR